MADSIQPNNYTVQKGDTLWGLAGKMKDQLGGETRNERVEALKNVFGKDPKTLKQGDTLDFNAAIGRVGKKDPIRPLTQTQPDAVQPTKPETPETTGPNVQMQAGELKQVPAKPGTKILHGATDPTKEEIVELQRTKGTAMASPDYNKDGSISFKVSQGGQPAGEITADKNVEKVTYPYADGSTAEYVNKPGLGWKLNNPIDEHAFGVITGKTGQEAHQNYLKAQSSDPQAGLKDLQIPTNQSLGQEIKNYAAEDVKTYDQNKDQKLDSADSVPPSFISSLDGTTPSPKDNKIDAAEMAAYVGYQDIMDGKQDGVIKPESIVNSQTQWQFNSNNLNAKVKAYYAKNQGLFQ